MRIGPKARASAIAVLNLLKGSNVASLGLATRPRACLGYANEALFLYRTLTGRHGLPTRNVFDGVRGPAVSTITLANPDPAVERSWFHAVSSYATDIVSLCLLCRMLEARTIFEIGTLRGYTALHFALNSPADATIFSLDLPLDRPGGGRLATTVVDDAHIDEHRAVRSYCFDGTEVAHKVRCLFGDSATFDYSPSAGRVDLFFIDGAHSYEYVRSDTVNALACCHPGSVIAWHDFGRVGVNGVTRWLREFSAGRRVYAVPGGSLAYMVVP